MNKLSVEVSDEATQPKGKKESRLCTYFLTPVELGTSCLIASKKYRWITIRTLFGTDGLQHDSSQTLGEPNQTPLLILSGTALHQTKAHAVEAVLKALPATCSLFSQLTAGEGRSHARCAGMGISPRKALKSALLHSDIVSNSFRSKKSNKKMRFGQMGEVGYYWSRMEMEEKEAAQRGEQFIFNNYQIKR